MGVRLAAALVIGACSGRQGHVAVKADATPPPHAPVTRADASVPVASGPGDVAVRVEWKDVPPAIRSSPGRTKCNTPRPAAVVPSTLWGIADVLVQADGPAATPAPHGARLTASACAVTPRLTVVALGATVLIENVEVGSAGPIQLALSHHGMPLTASEPATEPAAEPARAVYLPTVGHAVAVPIRDAGLYAVELVDPTTGIADPTVERAWIVATSDAAAITDDSGLASLRGLTAGPHVVTAWLPARAGQGPRLAHGAATVTAGELAETTVSLVPSAAPSVPVSP